MSGRAALHFEFWVFVAVLLGVFAFAIWKGDRPERLGAWFNLLAGLTATALDWIIRGNVEALLLLAVDAALAIGFLYLALRYGALWVGMALLLQGVQFSLHAYFFVTGMAHGLPYAVMNNLDTDGINLSIVAGTALAWRRRVRERRALAG